MREDDVIVCVSCDGNMTNNSVLYYSAAHEIRSAWGARYTYRYEYEVKITA